MSLRHGVTTMEESKMKRMVKEGATWNEIAAELQDCDLDYVKKNLYEPMVKAQKAADAELADLTGDEKPKA